MLFLVFLVPSVSHPVAGIAIEEELGCPILRTLSWVEGATDRLIAGQFRFPWSEGSEMKLSMLPAWTARSVPVLHLRYPLQSSATPWVRTMWACL